MRKSTRTRRPVATDPHEGAGRRLSPRVPVQSDCAVLWAQSRTDGVLVDISTGGAAVEILSQVALAPGDEVTLELPTVLSVVTVGAAVVSQDEETFGKFVLRLKFSEVAEELRTLISNRAATFRERQAAIFLGHV